VLYPLSYGRTWAMNTSVYQSLHGVHGFVVAHGRALYGRFV
jgi:hypothetical protein